MERRTAEVSVPIPDDSSYSHGSVSSGDADGSKTAKQVAENANESRTHGLVTMANTNSRERCEKKEIREIVCRQEEGCYGRLFWSWR